MIRIELSEEGAREVEEEFRTAENRNYRDRLQIVLLAHRGRPHRQIAADRCVSTRSVTRWLHAYCDPGLAGLVPRKARGKESAIPASLADQLKGWVIQGPAAQGLDRANWTDEELADHLLKIKGSRTSRSAMHRFGAKIGIRP